MYPSSRASRPMRRSASLNVRQYASLSLRSLDPLARKLGHVVA